MTKHRLEAFGDGVGSIVPTWLARALRIATARGLGALSEIAPILRVHTETFSAARDHALRMAGAALFATVALSGSAAAEDAKALTPESAVNDYCAAWSVTDRSARDHLLARVWAVDGVYSDPEPTLAKGRAALSDVIATFQRHYPGTHFRCSEPQMHHGAMRVSWSLFRPDGSQMTHGVDIYDMARDGRVQRIVGFFGDPPAVAPDLPAKASAPTQDGGARIVGTWRLISAIERMRDGTERPDPKVGPEGLGYITYTPTGQVCAMLGSQRAPWAVADQPSASEAGEIANRLVAYCGTYSVDEAGGFVVHHVEIDLSPNRTATDRKRFYTVTGDRLTLRAAPPLPDDAQALTITWERVR